MGRVMTKHYEVVDAHTREAVMRVSSQDQLLMALWELYKKGEMFYDQQIIYVDTHEQRHYVIEVADDLVWSWFESMDELHTRLMVDYGTSTLGFLEFLSLGNYHVEFTEVNTPLDEIDTERYYAQVVGAEGGPKAFASGATRLEAAAYAFMMVKNLEDSRGYEHG
jgi:hypothetical protein